MADTTLDRLLGRKAETAADVDGMIDVPEDHGCFGWLRGVRDRAVMLELRKRTGEIKAFSYSFLESVEFDPSDGMVLLFPGHRVTITGTALNQPATATTTLGLFGGVIRHRVPWIQELTGERLIADSESQIRVRSIIW